MASLMPIVAAVAAAAAGFLGAWWLRGRGGRNALLAQAFEALPLARQIATADGRVVASNAAYERMFGARDLQVPTALAGLLVGGEADRGRIETLGAAAAAGTAGRIDLAVRRPDKAQNGVFEITVRPLPRRPGLLLWGVEDVSPRRQVERTVRQQLDRFADLLENAPIGFYSVDREGRFLFLNATLARWLGLSGRPDDLRLHQMVATQLPPETPAYDPFGSGGAAMSGEVAMRGPGGRGFQAYIVQEIVEGEAGQALRTRSVVYGLGRERELEAALVRSEQRFRRFFAEAPIGIALIDRAGRLEEANEALQNMLDGAGLAAGLSFYDLLLAEGRPMARERLDAVRAGEPGRPFDVRLGDCGGRVATLYAARREESSGDPSGLIVYLTDATERRRLEMQFAQSQKMQAVGQLAGGIAHDFNNLLTAMIGFCDLLLLRHRAGDQSFADIMQIKQNANRAANLVRQLLAFSRQQTLQPRVLSVTDVLAELSHLLRRLIGENIELEMLHGRDQVPVRVDHGQLEQVIINLAVNARDAMQSGGKLTIRTSNANVRRPLTRGGETMPAGEYALIEVIDTGTGIPPAIIDRIFDPFFSTKEVGSGTGLGLSTVYGIVKQTGGFVFVDSRPGEGAAFGIYLPRWTGDGGAEAARPAAAEGAADLTGIGTVLLVEDEDAVRLFGARALRNKGYRVLEARSGEAALEIINAHSDSIDLLITDVVMPRMDGPTLIREVRSKRPDMKVIFISGYAEDDFRRRIDENADIHFLPKPFSLKQLAGKVKEVLGEGTA